jgi:hypothetical protein
MDELIELVSQSGVLLRREALANGFTDQDLSRGLRHGLLRRVRHGAYTTPEHWDHASATERHRLRCIAVDRSLKGQVVFTHTSALVMHGVAIWGASLDRVHVTRLDGIGRTDAGVVHHEGRVAEAETTTAGGLLVTTPGRAVVEHASLTSVESGLVSADSALRRNDLDFDQLARQFMSMEHWPGTRRVHIVVRLADGRAESAGETRSRYLCWRHHLPAPELQFEVYDEFGLVGVTDMAWPERKLLGEFDGKIKYGRLLKPGQEPGDVVFAEKRREDRLREITGWQMVRLVWSDLEDAAYTASRIRRMLFRAA